MGWPGWLSDLFLFSFGGTQTLEICTWVREEFPGVADEGDGWSDVDGTVVDERRVCNPSVTGYRRPCVLWYKDVVAPERVLSSSSRTILLISSVAKSF